MSVSQSMTSDESEQLNESSSEHDHAKPRYDDVNIPVIFMLGTFSAIMTFVIICFVRGLYYSWNESSVQRDWSSTVMTPQEETIVKQTAIRDGFYETKDGRYFVSVDVAAKKLLNSGGDVSALDQFDAMPSGGTKKANAEGAKGAEPKTGAEKPTRPEPPGPEDKDAK